MISAHRYRSPSARSIRRPQSRKVEYNAAILPRSHRILVVHKQNSTIHFLTPLWRHILRDWLVIYLIVLGAMLLTDYLRYQINLRNTQQITSVDTYNVLLASSIVGAISSLAERGLFKAATSKPARFRGVLVAVIVTSAVMVGFRSDASIQQIVVFSLLSLLIGAVVILLPPTLVERGKEVTVIDQLKRLAKHRSLLRIMVQYRIASRYSQTLLGILWIILLPLTTSIILSFVFSVIMRPLDIGNAPFISFLLAGMTFWTFFNQGLSQSAWAIVRSMGLINQVYFPREILVLAQLGETLIDLVFMFTAMVIINLFVGILPSVWFVCIPLLLLVQIAFMLGIMFFLSYLSVYIRDISQLVVLPYSFSST